MELIIILKFISWLAIFSFIGLMFYMLGPGLGFVLSAVVLLSIFYLRISVEGFKAGGEQK